MSGEPFHCGYGAIVREDVAVLESCLRALLRPVVKESVRVLEIGMHDGATARGIEEFVRGQGAQLDYWGVDPDDGTTRPRYVPDRGLVIIGDSAEVFPKVPDGLDLVWVDGCHCRNHVILDTVNYAPKVNVGGFICYHDANPVGQGKFHQYHGPDTPEFGLGISAALKAIRFPWEGWELHTILWPEDREDCGTVAFRRVK